MMVRISVDEGITQQPACSVRIARVAPACLFLLLLIIFKLERGRWRCRGLREAVNQHIDEDGSKLITGRAGTGA